MAASRPVITISAAVSLDGKLASRSGDSAISSKQDLMRLHRLRSGTDAILVGSRTLRRDDPRLTVRHVDGPDPACVILDSAGTAPSDAAIFHAAPTRSVIVAVSARATDADRRRLRRLGAEVVACGTDTVDLDCLLAELGRRRIRTLLVEGGGTVNWSFVGRGLFDRMIVTISPVILGGAGSVTLADGGGFASVAGAARLCLDKMERIGDEVVLHYSRYT